MPENTGGPNRLSVSSIAPRQRSIFAVLWSDPNPGPGIERHHVRFSVVCEVFWVALGGNSSKYAFASRISSSLSTMDKKEQKGGERRLILS